VSRTPVVVRRVVFVGVVVLQLTFVARGYWSDHKEFAFQMFPEASTWKAEIVRVLRDGRVVAVDDGWNGYQWSALVRDRYLQFPGVRHHADSGVDSQLAFLRAALDWVAAHTPDDDETRYLEADVTYVPAAGLMPGAASVPNCIVYVPVAVPLVCHPALNVAALMVVVVPTESAPV